jgi:biotin operon repressor/transcriptional regulator with XRE-family HTH domain
MTPKAKSTALILSGAVALSFTAYAIGSQSGSGSADAESAAAASAAAASSSTANARPAGFGRGGPDHRGGPGFGPALDELAKELGVSTSALQNAFEDARDELMKTHLQDREDHLKALADALGVTEAKLSDALGTLRPERGDRADHHAELAAALAKELGTSAAKVRAAFEKAHGRGRRGDRGAALATALGMTRAKLEQAFRNLRDDFGNDHEGDRAADLAKALGISQAKVEAAFDKLRVDHEAEEQKMRDALAASLAKNLKLDEAKVKAALEDLAPERGGHRRRH